MIYFYFYFQFSLITYEKYLWRCWQWKQNLLMLQPILCHPTLLVTAKNPLMTRNPLLGKRPSDPGNNMKKQCVFFIKCTIKILLLWTATMEILLFMKCNGGNFTFMKCHNRSLANISIYILLPFCSYTWHALHLLCAPMYYMCTHVYNSFSISMATHSSC